jgi:hypothetical protein
LHAAEHVTERNPRRGGAETAFTTCSRQRFADPHQRVRALRAERRAARMEGAGSRVLRFPDGEIQRRPAGASQALNDEFTAR